MSSTVPFSLINYCPHSVERQSKQVCAPEGAITVLTGSTEKESTSHCNWQEMQFETHWAVLQVSELSLLRVKVIGMNAFPYNSEAKKFGVILTSVGTYHNLESVAVTTSGKWEHRQQRATFSRGERVMWERREMGDEGTVCWTAASDTITTSLGRSCELQSHLKSPSLKDQMTESFIFIFMSGNIVYAISTCFTTLDVDWMVQV